MKAEHSKEELQSLLKLSDRHNFKKLYLNPALDTDLIERTLPDKPNSRLQKYRLTEKGRRASHEAHPWSKPTSNG